MTMTMEGIDWEIPYLIWLQFLTQTYFNASFHVKKKCGKTNFVSVMKESFVRRG